MDKKKFVKKLLALVADATDCAIQHNGCPCNSCFHSWACDELELNTEIAHAFWLVLLALRGDYKEADILEGLKENSADILKEGD